MEVYADRPKLIAIMLGRLRMNINECIDASLSLSDSIFEKKRHKVTIQGKIQRRFGGSRELARIVKRSSKDMNYRRIALLKDSSEAGCKV